MAAEITANSPMGVWMTKEVAWSQLEVGSLQAGIDLENRTQIMTTFTRDHHEQITAFLEKRPPALHQRVGTLGRPRGGLLKPPFVRDIDLLLSPVRTSVRVHDSPAHSGRNIDIGSVAGQGISRRKPPQCRTIGRWAMSRLTAISARTRIRRR